MLKKKKLEGRSGGFVFVRVCMPRLEVLWHLRSDLTAF